MSTKVIVVSRQPKANTFLKCFFVVVVLVRFCVSSSKFDKVEYNMCSYPWILQNDIQHSLEVTT